MSNKYWRHYYNISGIVLIALGIVAIAVIIKFFIVENEFAKTEPAEAEAETAEAEEFTNPYDDYNWEEDETVEGNYDWLADAPKGEKTVEPTELTSDSNVFVVPQFEVKVELDSSSDFIYFAFESATGYLECAVLTTHDNRIRWIEYSYNSPNWASSTHLRQEYCPACYYAPDHYFYKFDRLYGEAAAYYEYAGIRIYFSQQQLDFIKKALRGRLTLADTELGLGYLTRDGHLKLQKYLKDSELPAPEEITMADGRPALRYDFGWPSFELALTEVQSGKLYVQPTFYCRATEDSPYGKGHPRYEWEMDLHDCAYSDYLEYFPTKLMGKKVRISEEAIIGIMQSIQDSNYRADWLDDNHRIYNYGLEQARKAAGIDD